MAMNAFVIGANAGAKISCEMESNRKQKERR